MKTMKTGSFNAAKAANKNSAKPNPKPRIERPERVARLTTGELKARVDVIKDAVTFGASLIGRAFNAVADRLDKSDEAEFNRRVSLFEKVPEEAKAQAEHERSIELNGIAAKAAARSALGEFFGKSYVKLDDLAIKVIDAAATKIIATADLGKLFEVYAMSKLSSSGNAHEEEMMRLHIESLRAHAELLKQQQAGEDISEATTLARLAIDRAETAARMAQSAKDQVADMKKEQDGTPSRQ